MLRNVVSQGVAVVVLSVVLGAQTMAATQKARLEVTADTGITSVRGRFFDSNGAGPSTPIRQNQNWSGFEAKALLINFNTAPIRGWIVQEAWLHLFVARGDLYGVGLCEMLAPWREGRGMNGQEQTGAPCWQFARLPKNPAKPAPADLWAWPGSGIYSVSWAHPMARHSYAGPDKIEKEVIGKPSEAGQGPAVSTRPADKRFIHLRIPVKPELVASLAAGACYGFVLTDDKGQVAESYSLVGPGYPYRYNESEDAYVFTKDIQEPSLRPYLEVHGEPAGEGAPGKVEDLKVAGVEASTSTVTLEFTVPDSANGLLAYQVLRAQATAAQPPEAGEPLPRWAIPLPGKPGTTQRMPIWTLPPGTHVLTVRAVDVAGRAGEPASLTITVPDKPEAKLLEVASETNALAGEQPVAPEVRLDPASPNDGYAGGTKPAVASAEGGQPQVYVVPDMVKVDPVQGAVLQDGNAYQVAPGYALRNPVWDASQNRISLRAAANEVVAFQVIVRKDDQPLRNVRVKVADLAGPDGRIAADPNARTFRAWYIQSARRDRRPVGPNEDEITDTTVRPVAWHADAAVPMTDEFRPTVDVPAAENRIDGQTNQAIWVDLYVPKGTGAGDYAGEVTVEADGLPQPVRMDLALKVLPLELPDQSSWIVELNSYGGLAGYAGVSGGGQEAREAEWRFYQLAKQHRQMINALPYKQSGRLEPTAPKLDGDGAGLKVADWTPFDEHFGPLLDGSAFTAAHGYVGPGAGTPISGMYLHFHENWPLPLDKWYGDYKVLKTRLEFGEWAKTSRLLDEAFPDEYKQGYRAVARQFVEHFREKGWTRTVYQFFLNNKYYFKVPYFASEMTAGTNGTSFWLLDEPVDHDDYMANAFFMGLTRDGWRQAKASDVKFAFRTDVSQPEMTRGLWNGICDLWVCSGGAIRSGYVTTAAVRQKWLPGEEFWHYGGGSGVSAAPVDMFQAFLNSWASGSTGMLPYWTTNGGANWVRPGEPDLAIFYTGRNYANSGQNYPGPLASLRMKIMRRAQQDIEYLHLLAAKPGWDRARVREALKPYADDPAAPVLLFEKLTAQQQNALRARLVATILGAR